MEFIKYELGVVLKNRAKRAESSEHIGNLFIPIYKLYLNYLCGDNIKNETDKMV